MAMRKSTRRELRKLRELVRVLLDGKTPLEVVRAELLPEIDRELTRRSVRV